jgi:Amidases related to nicotinamidase
MKPATPPARTALLVIDVQNDFMEGGALAVPGAAEILPVVNALLGSDGYALKVGTQDMHPDDHVSFAVWPRHCVAGTRGAELHPGLDKDRLHVIWRKGTERDVDSYGACYDNADRPTRLVELLQAHGVTAVDVVGLATDYCVGNTALQAARHFKTRVLLAGCRGVGLKPTDVPEMLRRLREAGVGLVDA